MKKLIGLIVSILLFTSGFSQQLRPKETKNEYVQRMFSDSTQTNIFISKEDELTIISSESLTRDFLISTIFDKHGIKQFSFLTFNNAKLYAEVKYNLLDKYDFQYLQSGRFYTVDKESGLRTIISFDKDSTNYYILLTYFPKRE